MPNQPSPSPKTLSRRDAAVVLGLHERTIDRLVRAGTLPAIKAGSRVLITVEGIDAMLHPRRPR